MLYFYFLNLFSWVKVVHGYNFFELCMWALINNIYLVIYQLNMTSCIHFNFPEINLWKSFLTSTTNCIIWSVFELKIPVSFFSLYYYAIWLATIIHSYLPDAFASFSSRTFSMRSHITMLITFHFLSVLTFIPPPFYRSVDIRFLPLSQKCNL